MIHQYKNNGVNIVLDVYSGAIHVVDDIVYDIIALYEENDETSIIQQLNNKYNIEQIKKAIEEINILIRKELLFTEDTYKEFIPNLTLREPIVKALCLHIAHDCNLCCKYCFAGEGEYHGDRSMMSLEVGKKAIDFLIKNSGKRRNLEVDFFGGEPLMNFDVVKEIVKYARENEVIYNKKFRFTLTTNGILLSEEIQTFLNENMYNVVLSIDGRKKTNDAMRPSANGKGSYDLILPRFKEFVKKRGQKDYYVRGTFTHYNLDFASDVLHLADEGFEQISVEPVVASEEADYRIREKDLPILFKEYDHLAKEMLNRYEQGKGFNFFHFMIDLNQGPCISKRLSGCGSGSEYLAVTPWGDLYPCHQYVGLDEFLMGNVVEGIKNKNKQKEFMNCNVYTKEKCKECWAKFYCSGGCSANAYQFYNDIQRTYDIGCQLEKKRIESAIMIKAKLG
ncbi:MAG: thioether cross-link-forming SCIFF peptide maturase [Eubacteriales bacterium]